MVFNSVAFGLFLPAVLVLHWVSGPRMRNPVLLAASYLFYGFWDWRFLGLIGLSTVVDYMVGVALARTENERLRRRLLWCSVTANLGVLALFKYAGFFVESLAALAGSVGIGLDQRTLSILLPVGISFYTFQTMSYTIDVYRRRLDPTTDFVLFATYVAYFPQLVAGPIERARNLLPRLADTNRARPNRTMLGAAAGLILLGLFKKVVVADGVAVVADALFDDPGSAGTLTAVAGIVAFSLQIYGDFSGYTDIARGVSLLFGIDLVVNFRQPYLSRSITEFWRRWHISLSDWLRDYLYIPLGGSRGGARATHRNLMITMLLGGLWHGASWNFVLWGGLHGLYLVFERRRGVVVSSRPVAVRDVGSIVTTFVVVSLTWVFFRAATFTEALEVFRALGRLTTSADPGHLLLVTVLALVMVGVDVVARTTVTSAEVMGRRPVSVGLGIGLALLALVVFSGSAARPFVYFQF